MEACQHTPETLHGETACAECGLVLDETTAVPGWTDHLNHGASMRPGAETKDYMTMAPGKFKLTQIYAANKTSSQIRTAKITSEINRLAYIFHIPQETVAQALKTALAQPHDFTLRKPLAAASLLLASSANGHPIPQRQFLKHTTDPRATRRIYNRLRAKYLPVAPDPSKTYLEKITSTLRYTPTEKQLAQIILEQISPKLTGISPRIKAATAAILASYHPGRIPEVAKATPCTEVGIRVATTRLFGPCWAKNMNKLQHRYSRSLKQPRATNSG